MSRFVVLFLCLFCFGHLEANRFNAQSCEQQNCIAVIDAGSTGTRLHIYAFDRNASSQPINIKEIWAKKINPGFASLNLGQSTIKSYLNILFADMPETNIPVYFYATAGMRLLSKPKQTVYFKELKQWFDNHPQWRLIDAKTITGNEEALFDWLAVNYQLDRFDHKKQPFVSVMDMGGASVQIVFPVKDTSQINPEDLIEVEIYDKKVKLFAHSFLGLGKNTFAYQFLDLKSCFSNSYSLPSGGFGQGDANACQGDISKLINLVHGVNSKVQPVIAENPVDQWYVLGGVNFLLTDRPFQFKASEQFTNQELLDQGDREVCHKQWSELQHENPNHDYIHSYCLLPSYYYALMVEGYGINPYQPVNLLPPSKNSDWTLGVVLHLN